MEILKKRNRPRCQHCNKAMTYNEILGKWECCNDKCFVTRVPSELVSSMHSTVLGFIVDATVPDTPTGLLDSSAKTAKNSAKTAKEIKSPQK